MSAEKIVTKENKKSGSPSDRREFFRLDFRGPVKFRLVQHPRNDLLLGTTANVSQSGVLFRSKVLPKIASILWMNMDLRTLQICQEIEKRALVHNNGILGRVVRVEEDRETDTYRIGVCFVTKSTAKQEQMSFQTVAETV